MPIQTSFTGINPNFRLIKILFVFTVILLPVTLCHSIRPIWFNPPSPSPSPSSSSNSFSADSINSVDSLNDYIQTSRLLDAIAANDLSSIDSDFESSLDADVNRNNLDGNVNPFSKDFTPQNSNLHIKTSSSPSSSIFNLNKEQKLFNTDSNSSNNSGISASLLPWIEPELITTLADDKSDKKMFKRGNEESSVSRVKKALSLFAHWKPTYKQHLDDAYSSELVSAVSRGHGRTAGQALRWG